MKSPKIPKKMAITPKITNNFFISPPFFRNRLKVELTGSGKAEKLKAQQGGIDTYLLEPLLLERKDITLAKNLSSLHLTACLNLVRRSNRAALTYVERLTSAQYPLDSCICVQV